jgi:hypothetical protein
MDLLTKNLADALRAVLPFANAVATDPFHLDCKAAEAAVAIANQALVDCAADHAETQPSVPAIVALDDEPASSERQTEREQVSVLVRVIGETPMSAGQILVAAKIAVAIESEVRLSAADVAALDQLLSEAPLSEEHAHQLRALRTALLAERSSETAARHNNGSFPIAPAIEARQAPSRDASGGITLTVHADGATSEAPGSSDNPHYDPANMRGMRLADLERLPHHLRAKAFFDLDRYYMLEHHKNRLQTLASIEKPDSQARRLIEQSRAAVDGTEWCIGRFDLHDESYMDLLDAANPAG